MATYNAEIGGSFVFQVLFLDASGDPVDPVDPTISIFRYESTGEKVAIFDGPLQASSPAETGRWVYVWAVPDTLLDGMVVYAEYKAGAISRLYSTDALNLFSFGSGDYLLARFIG